MNDVPSLLRNDGGNKQNWIKIKLVGTKCNRTAIGARVRVVTGNHSQIDEVRSGSSVMSQSDLRLHFGLGKAQTVDVIEVKWPTTQKIERFTQVKANQILTIREGSGIVIRLLRKRNLRNESSTALGISPAGTHGSGDAASRSAEKSWSEWRRAESAAAMCTATTDRRDAGFRRSSWDMRRRASIARSAKASPASPKAIASLSTRPSIAGNARTACAARSISAIVEKFWASPAVITVAREHSPSLSRFRPASFIAFRRISRFTKRRCSRRSRSHSMRFRWSTIPPDSTALVVGAGTIGLLLQQALRVAGCSRVFVADPDSTRLDLSARAWRERDNL